MYIYIYIKYGWHNLHTYMHRLLVLDTFLTIVFIFNQNYINYNNT